MKTTETTIARKQINHSHRLTAAYFWLAIFSLVYCARPEDWIPGLADVPLAKVTGIFALLAFVFSIRQIRWPLPREVVYLILLGAWLFVTVPMSSVWVGGALERTLEFAKGVIVVIVLVSTVSTLERLRRLIVIQAASVAAIAMVALWKGKLLLGRLEGVLGGNYSDPNDLALMIAISFPLCLALLLSTKNRLLKAGWAVAMLVMAYAIVQTGSRGGLLSIVVVTAVCLWEFAVLERRRYLLVAAALVVAVIWQTSGGLVAARLKGTFDPDESVAKAYDSSVQRQEVFWRSIAVTAEHPIFGVGPGNFAQLSGSWHVTHNSFTQMSAEGGVPALVLYLLILWAGFKNVREFKRLRQKNANVLAKALLASLAGYVVGSFFATVAYQFFPYILVAYTTTLLWIAKNAGSSSASRRSRTQAELALAQEFHQLHSVAAPMEELKA